MCPKDADRRAKSVDPDQTSPSGANSAYSEQSDLALYYLPRLVCPKT